MRVRRGELTNRGVLLQLVDDTGDRCSGFYKQEETTAEPEW